MNTIVKGFDAGKQDSEIKDVYTFTNKNYKVSIIYGAKLILAPTTLYQQLKMYVKFVRPRIIKYSYRAPSDRYLFAMIPREDESLGFKPMQHSTVTRCLTRSFEKASVFPKTACLKSGFCSRICCGKFFGKRFYVQYISNREVARLSWNCYSMSKPLNQEEEKAVKARQDVFGKKSVPTFRDLEKFYKQMKYKVKISSQVDVIDEGLKKKFKTIL